MPDRAIEFEKKANWLRNKVLEMTVAAGAGHVAPSFSCAEILVALYYGGVMRVDPRNVAWEDRDRFILSKGHGGIGWASVLGDKGYFDKDLLKNFNKTGSPFGMHLDTLKVKGCDASTGSLGHGLAIACRARTGGAHKEQELQHLRHDGRRRALRGHGLGGQHPGRPPQA